MNTLKIKQKIKKFVGRNSSNGRNAFVMSYFHHRLTFPNLKNPKNLSEIWIDKVLKGEINKYSYLADKYAVRDYVKRKGLGDILTPLIGVYDDVAAIDFSLFPERFALKANFGAGKNIICTDKSQLDIEATRTRLALWLLPYTYSYTEKHYNLIPQKIVCEEFIDDGTGGFPIDYKFMCIKGKVFCVLVCKGRKSGHADYLPYSAEWKPIYEYCKKADHSIELINRPANLQEMIQVAEKLSEDLDLVRIDLYSNGSRIWFGEVTLTPAGCIFPRWSIKALKEMGDAYRNN